MNAEAPKPPQPQNSKQLKHLVRAKVLVRRAELSNELRIHASSVVCQRLWEMREVQSAEVVMGYSSLIEELNINPLLERLIGRNTHVWLPRITGPGEMEAAPIKSLDDTRIGPMGINEPKGAVSDLHKAPHVVLVPGVSFDPEGNRLGVGQGYYDRFLANLSRRPYLIGVAFDEQMVRAIPYEDHDIQMDVVVTPSHIYR
ncbi:5-formyltetrahydrofolate cyclo-ligase [Stomatohabitans albus]|uniref:5-formyltetrahydrofolate cyclo-ligase n=1 Tax=Stomatohabitans albus TaxID=3110766 RepID=UPI00300DB893